MLYKCFVFAGFIYFLNGYDHFCNGQDQPLAYFFDILVENMQKMVQYHYHSLSLWLLLF